MTVDWPYAEGRGRPASHRGAGETPLVLVVEDHTLISVLMRDTLQSYGYRVLIANDAHEGIRLTWALRPDRRRRTIATLECLFGGQEAADVLYDAVAVSMRNRWKSSYDGWKTTDFLATTSSTSLSRTIQSSMSFALDPV